MGECDLDVMGVPSNPGLYLDRANRVTEVEESTVVFRNMNS
jgi:hypothetical protein